MNQIIPSRYEENKEQVFGSEVFNRTRLLLDQRFQSEERITNEELLQRDAARADTPRGKKLRQALK